MILFDTMLSKICSAIFIFSAILTLYIGKYKVPEVSKKTQLARTLTLGLWGFVPPNVAESVHQRNVWNWRKLLVCGVMMSSLSILMTGNKLSQSSSLKLSAVILTLWTLGLHLFWYLLIPPKETGEESASSDGGRRGGEGQSISAKGNGDDSSEQKSVVSEGWAQKIKTREGDHRLPTTIITGFLGSGKTTLVNHLLGNTIGLKILVVENEIGEEGIDHELLLQQTKKEQIILMNNGCVCCSVRGDLIQTFKQLFTSDAFSLLNWVVIETTGLADPGPVIQTLFMDEDCKKHMRLDACITVVDSKHIQQHFEAAAAGQSGTHRGLAVPEAIQQLAFADRILLNKVDLVTPQELVQVMEQVQTVNPTALILQTQQSQISPEQILNIHAFDASKNEIKFESNEIKGNVFNSSNTQKGLFHIETNADGKINIPKKKRGSSIGSLGKKRADANGTSSISTSNNLVSNSFVSTVSLTSTSLIDLDKFNMWMGQLLQEKGNDLYRFKGILAMAGYEEKFVVQGVHMLFNGERGDKWPSDGDRRSRLVFIGVNLNHSTLKSGFHNCLVSASVGS